VKRVRVIPVLLIENEGLVKTVKFRNPTYVGDPVNAVKIFNEKEIDEIVILDINATREKRPPNFKFIRQIAGEAFIPVAYGGGISSIEQIEQLFYLGVEKVIFNFEAFKNPNLISEVARLVGSQSVVVSIDVKKNLFGQNGVYVLNGKEKINSSPEQYAKHMQEIGVGEVFLNSIDRDGTYKGYDLALIRRVSSVLSIPLIACGGASCIDDFQLAIKNGASAVAAGSMFVFQRPHNAVLITYPNHDDLYRKLHSTS
jgi:imidazole glycerol-phosphate synthase subunit HisF